MKNDYGFGSGDDAEEEIEELSVGFVQQLTENLRNWTGPQSVRSVALLLVLYGVVFNHTNPLFGVIALMVLRDE